MLSARQGWRHYSLVKFSAKDKFVLYSELAKLQEAGFPMENALDTLEHHPLPPACLHFVRSTKQRLAEGKSITEAIELIEEIPIGGIERNLIEAGERGGKLADVFQHLANYFERVHEARRAVLRGLVYPAVLFHLAVFLSAAPRLFTVGLWAALKPCLIAMAIFYALVVVIWFGFQFLHRQSLAGESADRLLGRVPVLGKLRRMLALERFTEVFRIYLMTAFKPSEAIAAAGEASQSGYLRGHSSRVGKQLESGEALGPLLLSSRAFPKDFSAAMSTAEQAGTLDKELRRWSNHYSARAVESFARLEAWLPKIVYAVICVYVVWQIGSVYFGYLNTATGILDDI